MKLPLSFLLNLTPMHPVEIKFLLVKSCHLAVTVVTLPFCLTQTDHAC